MKKIILILLALLSASANAQPLLRLKQHVPNYYYATPDTAWWDYYEGMPCLSPSGNPWRVYFCSGNYTNNGMKEFARYCYAEKPMKIIGVAAGAMIWKRNTNLDLPRLPEYFNLYEINDADSLVLLASARWDTASPKFRMQHTVGATPVYEAYFDEPVTVTDSFYVAATAFNNSIVYIDSNRTHVAARRQTNYLFLELDTVRYIYPKPEEARPKPDHYRYKFHHFDSLYMFFEIDKYDPDYHVPVYDTFWHTARMASYYCIFPIYDTTGKWKENRLCPTPTGLRAVDVEDNTAFLAWDDDSTSVSWQLLLRQDGSSDSTLITLDSLAITLTGLNDNTWYSARLRSVCDTSFYGIATSLWCDSLAFFVTEDTSSHNTQVCETDSDPSVSLAPNPAAHFVTVKAASAITHIEVYNTLGVAVKRETPNSNSFTLDIANLAQGIYNVRVTTRNGSAVRKLTVR